MGFFDKFKSQRDIAKEEIVEVPWKILNNMDQLDTIISESETMPVAIFKHSTRCGVSRGVLRAFEKDYTLSEEKVKLYFLDLLANRDISNEIAERFKVHHESPQLIVLKNGKVAQHASHNAINAVDLKRFV